ncbi:SLC13 family permease [Paenibacillus sp. FJAT-26967]|uniref:SLC13 family permease n=1 Tax=Paenibacillus sp. FJAT-26967 TaxID=1729690 RepID=UPI0008399301|nr:SLC13 family permease [Paenibacillus sp. FJAT-26967]
MHEAVQAPVWQAVTALAVFAAVLIGMIQRVKYRSLFPAAGALLLLLSGIVTPVSAIRNYIPWEALYLALGVAAAAYLLDRAGLLQLAAVRFDRLTGGHPSRMLAVIMLLSALGASLLDAAAAMAALLPLTLAFAKSWGIPSAPYTAGMMLACNLGGSLSVIGTMPGRLIGTAGELSFASSWLVLGPLTLILLVLAYLMVWAVYARTLQAACPIIREPVSSPPVLTGSAKLKAMQPAAVVFVIMAGGFFISHAIGIRLAHIAAAGALVLLLLVIKRWAWQKSFGDLNVSLWVSTAGWFIITGGLIQTGVISGAAGWIMKAMPGDEQWLALSVLWMTAIGSSLSDSLALTALSIPVVGEMISVLQAGGAAHADRLWYVLLAGTHLGANATCISSLSSLLAFGSSLGRPGGITFREYLRIGIPFSFFSLTLSSLYLVGFWFGNN